MAEYRAIYKCRMCGDEYSTVGAGENIAFQSIVGITGKDFFYPKALVLGYTDMMCIIVKTVLSDFRTLSG